MNYCNKTHTLTNKTTVCFIKKSITKKKCIKKNRKTKQTEKNNNKQKQNNKNEGQSRQKLWGGNIN